MLIFFIIFDKYVKVCLVISVYTNKIFIIYTNIPPLFWALIVTCKIWNNETFDRRNIFR